MLPEGKGARGLADTPVQHHPEAAADRSYNDLHGAETGDQALEGFTIWGTRYAPASGATVRPKSFLGAMMFQSTLPHGERLLLC